MSDKKYKVPRSIKSWAMANIILNHGLFDEFKVFCYKHPKVKSKFRAGNLFLLHKKMRYAHCEKTFPVNMDSLEQYYYGY